MKKVFLLSILMFILIPAYAEFSHVRQLSFNNGDVSEDLIDFTVLVYIDPNDNDFWNNIGAGFSEDDSADLRFFDSDENTELFFEIENVDTANNTAYIWVKVPQINANSMNDFILMYWGDPTATETVFHDPASAWSSAYHGIYHLAEGVWNGTDGEIFESTGSMTQIAKAVGSVQNAEAFIDYGGLYPVSASETYIDLGPKESGSLASANESVSFWVKSDSLSQHGIIFATPRYSSNPFSIKWVAGRMRLFIGNGSSSGTSTWEEAVWVNDNQWHHVVCQKNGTDGSLTNYYVDGVQVPTATGINSSQWLKDNYCIGGRTGIETYNFDGMLDEMRFAPQNLSSDWIYATYLSESGAYIRESEFTVGSADLNNDGEVDFIDFALFAQQWLQ